MKITVDSVRWLSDGSGDWLMLRTRQARKICDTAKAGKTYDVDIKPHRERRSLDANGYLWVLLDKLAVRLTTTKAPVTKVDIYRRLIPDVGGVSTVVDVLSCAVPDLCKAWQGRGIGWIAEELPSNRPGHSNVILYYGSSEYDTHQMHRLLDLVIAECEAQGIETMTPAQLAGLEGY